MSNQLSVVKQSLKELEAAVKSPSNVERVASALGIKTQEQMQDAEQFLSSVLSCVRNADPKTKIHSCSPESIIDSAIDAAQMRVAIDGRQHANIIAYFNKDKGCHEASLQITAKGYESKLYECLEDCDIKTEAIFEGDLFEKETVGNIDIVRHKSADPFQDDVKKLKGVYVSISYTKSGEKYNRVFIIPKSELDKIKGKAKQSYVWGEWYIERGKTAAIKRACKRYFQNSVALNRLVDYDNEKNYQAIEDVSRSSNNIIDNINKQISGDLDNDTVAIEDNTQDVEDHGEVDVSLESLIKVAEEAALKGLDSYEEFFTSLTKGQRKTLAPEHERLKTLSLNQEDEYQEVEGDIL